jgi:hypothetical protein
MRVAWEDAYRVIAFFGILAPGSEPPSERSYSCPVENHLQSTDNQDQQENDP